MSEYLLVSGVILTLAGLGCWWTGRCASLWTRDKAAEISLVLLDLMRDLQLHRALSGALLDGRTEFNDDLEAAESKLQRSLHELADQYGEHHPILRTDAWHGVLDRWESLYNNWHGLDFHTNLCVHNEVVQGQIEVLRALSVSHARQLGRARAHIIAHWPTLIEQLGMLRALGMHALSKRRFDEDDRVVDSIGHYLYSARGVLQAVSCEIANRTLLIRSERALARVAWLMDGNAGRYHPYTYYEEMTGVIDEWYRLATTRLQAGQDDRGLIERLAMAARTGLKTGG